MEDWTTIRRRILVDGESKRQVLRETGMHWKTLEKMLTHSEPPGYRQQVARTLKKVGLYLERIKQMLKEEGSSGGYVSVWRVVRGLKICGQEVFLPLVHRPGEAQVDFGHALVNLHGQLTKVAFFVMVLPHRDAFFVQAFARECTATFWEGHVRAFEYFGGVAVVQIVGGTRERKLTSGFLQLQSHYLFAHHFCHVRRPDAIDLADRGGRSH